MDKSPEAIKLNGKQIFKKDYKLASIQHFDSLIVLTTGMNKFYHVFNIEGKPVASFGRKGKGPGEFLRIPILTNIYKHNSKVYGLVYDELLRKVINIDFRASITENKLVIHNRPPLPPKLRKSEILEYFYVGENKYAGMIEDRFFKQINQKRDGFYYNAPKNKFIILPLFNLKMKPYDKLSEANLNNRVARLSPDRSKLAFAMMYYPIVEVFDVGSKKPIRFLIDSNPPKGPFNLSDFKKGKLIKYFLGLHVTNNYLYLLSSVKMGNKYQKKGQLILVMDWKGNLKEKYLIPEKYDLNWINVDERNQRIYGISYDQDKAYEFDY